MNYFRISPVLTVEKWDFIVLTNENLTIEKTVYIYEYY